MRRWRYALAAAAVAGVLALAVPASLTEAATATSSFAVTATVQSTCLISTTAMAFGTYTGTLLNSTSTITLTCTNTTPYNVGLSPGTSVGATVAARAMTGGTTTLPYALYSDAARSVNWGQTVPTDTKAGTGNGAAQVLTVYGTITAGRFVTPGSYTDTVTATVTY